jgi:hypothetical protein
VKKWAAVVMVCLGVAVVVLVFELATARRGTTHTETAPPPTFNTLYEAVLLDNGLSYYGKLSHLDTNFPLMTDVYYIVRTEDPKTHQVSMKLVKRGNELHAPTETYLNAQHIVMIEPVGPNSQVAQLIAQSQAAGH